MDYEQKILLLKDLCARLPYGVMIEITSDGGMVEASYDMRLDAGLLADLLHSEDDFKPYLRPMSSMTEEEETLFRCELPAIAKTDAQLVAMRMELFLKGHLDFNHLIEKGLALEAKEGMYKTE